MGLNKMGFRVLSRRGRDLFKIMFIAIVVE